MDGNNQMTPSVVDHHQQQQQQHHQSMQSSGTGGNLNSQKLQYDNQQVDNGNRKRRFSFANT